MADASRFPQGIVISFADATTPTPVGTIIYDVATNTFKISTDASVATYTTIGIGAAGTAVTSLADVGSGVAIPVDKSYSMNIASGAGAETNTLAAPTFTGQQILLAMGTDGGGNRVVTVTSTNGFNQAGNTIITFADVEDNVKLLGIWKAGALAWQIVNNNGAALS